MQVEDDNIFMYVFLCKVKRLWRISVQPTIIIISTIVFLFTSRVCDAVRLCLWCCTAVIFHKLAGFFSVFFLLWFISISLGMFWFSTHLLPISFFLINSRCVGWVTWAVIRDDDKFKVFGVFLEDFCGLWTYVVWGKCQCNADNMPGNFFLFSLFFAQTVHLLWMEKEWSLFQQALTLDYDTIWAQSVRKIQTYILMKMFINFDSFSLHVTHCINVYSLMKCNR